MKIQISGGKLAIYDCWKSLTGSAYIQCSEIKQYQRGIPDCGRRK